MYLELLKIKQKTNICVKMKKKRNICVNMLRKYERSHYQNLGSNKKTLLMIKYFVASLKLLAVNYFRKSFCEIFISNV